MNIYQSKVGLQGGPTQAQASYQTPVADAIGGAAGVASQFTQDYQAAKLKQNTTEYILGIKNEVNKYNEYRRRNEVELAPGDDLVQKREEDFIKFSQGINKSISQYKDPKVTEAIQGWWSEYSENVRSGVVNNAITDDINFMSKKQGEMIQSSTANYKFDEAEELINDGVANKLLTMSQAEDYMDGVNLERLMYNTREMTIEEGEQYINESNLDEDEKRSSIKIFNGRRVVREEKIDNATTIYNNGNHNDLMTAIITDKIISDGDLVGAYGKLQNASYEDNRGVVTEIEGSASAFQEDSYLSMYNLLQKRQKERADAKKGEGDPDIPDEVEEYLADIMFAGTRDQLNTALWHYMETDDISTEQANVYRDKANRSPRPALNDAYAEAFKTQLNKLVSEKFIPQSAIGSITKRWNDIIEAYPDEERYKEKYYDDMNDFFTNIQEDIVVTNINKIRQSKLNYADDYKTQDAFEKIIQEGRDKDLVGLIDPVSMRNFVMSDGISADTLKEQTSIYLYEKSYKDLDDTEKEKKVDKSVAIGEYGRIMLDEAKQIISPESQPFIDPQGIPYVKTPEGSFRMELNTEGTQQVWTKYSYEGGVKGWYPTEEYEYEPIEKKSVVSTIGNAFKDFITPEEKTRVENMEENINKAAWNKPLQKQMLIDYKKEDPSSYNNLINKMAIALEEKLSSATAPDQARIKRSYQTYLPDVYKIYDEKYNISSFENRYESDKDKEIREELERIRNN